MAVERGEEEKQPPPALSPWDCGSPLYDAFELASVYRVLDTHLMALPHARRPSPARAPRGTGDDETAALVAERAAAKAKANGRSRRRRTVAKAARRTGKAVLHTICRSVAACGGRRA
ncbi:hypothetical protein BAE44_0025055 [Dichanthelium oligosanthes]|uniref:Uncharacterized protein n=1 Tax=Dichanthelium oligosanthes TaxID=888268 RepID=A0A1E5UM36_9POAL|nr:hypothetical protein BAE44_0025055 [Dichanthelium oligosanthes]